MTRVFILRESFYLARDSSFDKKISPPDIEKVSKEDEAKGKFLKAVSELKGSDKRMALVALCANEQAFKKRSRAYLIINYGRNKNTEKQTKKYDARIEELAEIEEKLMTETSTPTEEISRL